MILIFWMIIRFFLLTTTILLACYLLLKLKKDKSLETLNDGIKEGLRGCGFAIKKSRYPLELYKWKTKNDKHVCVDCQERATWPAMDIADWMKQGLPNTKEASTCCNYPSHKEKRCRCELILVDQEIDSPSKPHKYLK